MKERSNILVENMIWRNHKIKYGPYLATEGTQFEKIFGDAIENIPQAKYDAERGILVGWV